MHSDRRAISRAPDVLAIYTAGLSDPRFGDLVSAVSADGWAIWSRDRLEGGPPYYEAAVEPGRVREALDRLEHDGLFADLAIINYGIISSSYCNICVRSRFKKFDMLSAHERFEADGRSVAESHGVTDLRRRPSRLQILSQQPAEWLYSRMVWLELRTMIYRLLPNEGAPVEGYLEFVTAQDVSWVYGAAHER